mgnify:CR=1 FL=1
MKRMNIFKTIFNLSLFNLSVFICVVIAGTKGGLLGFLAAIYVIAYWYSKLVKSRNIVDYETQIS